MSELSNSDLPDDIIVDILLRLPVKPVGRFRCVSKPWRSFLSSPQFLKTHRKLHTDDPGYLILTSDDGPYIHPYSCCPAAAESSTATNDGVARKVQYSELELAEVVGSCDGLILLEDSGLLLINPITLESAHIRDDRELECFDQLWFRYGFGYDRSSDDYKIVSLRENDYDPVGVVDVYSLRMKCWKRIDDSPFVLPGRNEREPAPGVFLSGRIHWMGYDHILCFDLACDKFVEGVLFPDSVEPEWFEDGVMVFNGCLALVSDCGQVDDKYLFLEVWVMKDYGVQDSWTKFTTISIDNVLNAYNLSRNCYVCALNKDDYVLEKQWDDKQLVAYNWRNGITRDLVISSFPKRSFGSRVVPFEPSLLSPNF